VRSSSSGSLLASLAVGLLALQLAVAVPWALRKSAGAGLQMIHVAGETPSAKRARTYGPAYVGAIEEIRRKIPPDGAYVLLNGSPEDVGAPIWVKFDLAPRRAVYLGNVQDLGNVDRLRRRIPRAARWFVIAYGSYGRPVLVERYKFMRQFRERRGA
jgi:hypothetical protein